MANASGLRRQPWRLPASLLSSSIACGPLTQRSNGALKLDPQQPELRRSKHTVAVSCGGMLSLLGRASTTARFFLRRSQVECVRDIAASKPSRAMLRPATLDRVENGGSGSDINSREQNQRRHSTTKGHFRPVFIQSAAVLKAVKARAWKRRSAPSMAERRPALTASARVGIGNLWSGRKKACSAVEQKKGLKRESKSARKKGSCIRGRD